MSLKFGSPRGTQPFKPLCNKANFKPLTLQQLSYLNFPSIPFEYSEEVYPGYELPLLFQSSRGLEWRKVIFGLVPKWAQDTTIATKL